MRTGDFEGDKHADRQADKSNNFTPCTCERGKYAMDNILNHAADKWACKMDLNDRRGCRLMPVN